MGGWTAETSATFVAALIGAVGAVTGAVLAAVEARAWRRNAKSLAEQTGWWDRWSWIADRASSEDPSVREAAALMLRQVRDATWSGIDDRTAANDFSRLMRKGSNRGDRVDG
jgi:hypothetical protein